MGCSVDLATSRTIPGPMGRVKAKTQDVVVVECAPSLHVVVGWDPCLARGRPRSGPDRPRRDGDCPRAGRGLSTGRPRVVNRTGGRFGGPGPAVWAVPRRCQKVSGRLLGKKSGGLGRELGRRHAQICRVATGSTARLVTTSLPETICPSRGGERSGGDADAARVVDAPAREADHRHQQSQWATAMPGLRTAGSTAMDEDNPGIGDGGRIGSRPVAAGRRLGRGAPSRQHGSDRRTSRDLGDVAEPIQAPSDDLPWHRLWSPSVRSAPIAISLGIGTAVGLVTGDAGVRCLERARCLVRQRASVGLAPRVVLVRRWVHRVSTGYHMAARRPGRRRCSLGLEGPRPSRPTTKTPRWKTCE